MTKYLILLSVLVLLSCSSENGEPTVISGKVLLSGTTKVPEQVIEIEGVREIVCLGLNCDDEKTISATEVVSDSNGEFYIELPYEREVQFYSLTISSVSPFLQGTQSCFSYREKVFPETNSEVTVELFCE